MMQLQQQQQQQQAQHAATTGRPGQQLQPHNQDKDRMERSQGG
jgi:hypothetical protein